MSKKIAMTDFEDTMTRYCHWREQTNWV